MIDELNKLLEELQRGLSGLADESVRTQGGIQALQMLRDRLASAAETAADADAPQEPQAESVTSSEPAE